MVNVLWYALVLRDGGSIRVTNAPACRSNSAVIEPVPAPSSTTHCVRAKSMFSTKRRASQGELGATAPEISLLAPFMVPARLLGFHQGTKKGLDPDYPRHLSRVVILD